MYFNDCFDTYSLVGVGVGWDGGGGGCNRFRDQRYRAEQFLKIAGYKRWKDRP